MSFVAKKGLNHGRTFSTCARPRGQGCEFHLWHDEEPLTPEHPSEEEMEEKPKISPDMEATVDEWLKDPAVRAKIESMRPDLNVTHYVPSPSDTTVKAEQLQSIIESIKNEP